MARTRTTSTTTAPAPAEAPVTTEENNVTTTDTTTTEAPAPTTTDEPKVDTFATFTTALDAALTTASAEDGVSDTVAAPVVEAYRALKGKARDKAAAHVADLMNAKIGAGDIPALGHIAALQQAYTAPTAKAPAEKAPVDPTEAFLAKITPLIAAVRLITDAAPEGVTVADLDLDTPAEALVEAVKAWMADEAEDKAPLTGDAAVAFKITQGKAPGTKKASSTRAPGAPRGNVDAHIQAVLDAAPDGATLTVADIVREGSDEYPAGTASQGAISNGVKRLGTKEGSGYVALGGPSKLGGVEGALSIKKG